MRRLGTILGSCILLGLVACTPAGQDFDSKGTDEPVVPENFSAPPGDDGPLLFPNRSVVKETDTQQVQPPQDAQDNDTAEDVQDTDTSDAVETPDIVPIDLDAENVPGLTCELLLACLDICSYLQNNDEKIDCILNCMQTADEPTQLATNQLLECSEAAECAILDTECHATQCPEQWAACVATGGPEEQDPSKPPLFCGPDNTVVCPDFITSDVEINVEHLLSQATPPLTGGELTSGDFGLEKVEVYSSSMLPGGQLPLTLDFTNNNSSGAVRIQDDAWSFSFTFSIYMQTQLGAVDYSNSGTNGGGCFSNYEGQIIGDILQCYEGTPDDNVPPPEHFPFEVTEDGGFKMLVQIPIEGIKSALEGSAAGGIASSVLVNDLDIVATWKPL